MAWPAVGWLVRRIDDLCSLNVRTVGRLPVDCHDVADTYKRGKGPSERTRGRQNLRGPARLTGAVVDIKDEVGHFNLK